MTARTLGKRLLGGSAALGVAAVVVMLLPTSAGANGPAKYGWWYEANQGLPVAPPPPPQVPSDGLYVANGFSGPTAVSALTFTVPSGAQLGPLTLKIAGNPTITQPPVACTLAASSEGYRAAQEGAWNDRPSYDCRKAQIPGSVDANKTTTTFNVDPFLANGTVSLVILAGGSADQVAFQKPDDGALQIANGDTGGAVGGVATPSSGAATGPESSDGQAASLPSQASSGDNYSQPLVDTGSGPMSAIPTAPSAPGTPASPASAAPTGGRGRAASPGYALGKPAAATVPQGWHSKTATGLGLTAILGALVAWTIGYGPLGGRVQLLSVRLRPPPPPTE